MAEAVNRYDNVDDLARRHEHYLAQHPSPDIFVARRMYAEQLAARWAKAGKKLINHGAAEDHFSLHVMRGDDGARHIELRCASANAYCWHVVQRVRKDPSPTVLGHQLRVTFITGSEG